MGLGGSSQFVAICPSSPQLKQYHGFGFDLTVADVASEVSFDVDVFLLTGFSFRFSFSFFFAGLFVGDVCCLGLDRAAI